MKWKYKTNGEKLVVVDHNGDKVAERDWSGYYTGRYPGEVRRVMGEKAREASQNGNMEYFRTTISLYVQEAIEYDGSDNREILDTFAQGNLDDYTIGLPS